MADFAFIPGVGVGIDTAFDVVEFLDDQKGTIAELLDSIGLPEEVIEAIMDAIEAAAGIEAGIDEFIEDVKEAARDALVELGVPEESIEWFEDALDTIGGWLDDAGAFLNELFEEFVEFLRNLLGLSGRSG